MPSRQSIGIEDAGRALPLERGRYRVREAAGDGDVAAAQALRGLAFFGPGGGVDRDAMDARCHHVLIEEIASGTLVACFRYFRMRSGADISGSYSAQYYNLDHLAAGFDGPSLELGRFCIRPGAGDADILRLSWGAITALVDMGATQLLFGCASFPGTDPQPYRAAFARLRSHHTAPERWQIQERAPERIRFGAVTGPDQGGGPATDAANRPGAGHGVGGDTGAGDPRAALRAIPPLLRTYLGMGGWVSDHAVIDRQMNTLHVFTAVEVATIPPARVRALRAIAG
ncbi:ornithine-acyl-ACP acyltransferase [Salipiger pallidus]|uniref:L-ornithine N(alpha)-acyltransferase n=1 Tax=Salipiger pallidus TaxID=1775170 RepID=A0A8J2ZKR6_9RHOB|nr:GNAT family N-acetyltransferase [Salipiger pallidus]GGG76626.1 ornithine-acyl-ACP acyltransferase [Salipiger pallidus]